MSAEYNKAVLDDGTQIATPDYQVTANIQLSEEFLALLAHDPDLTNQDYLAEVFSRFLGQGALALRVVVTLNTGVLAGHLSEDEARDILQRLFP